MRTLLRVAIALNVPLGAGWTLLFGAPFALAYTIAFVAWVVVLRTLDRTCDYLRCSRYACVILFGLCAFSAAALGGLHSNALGWLLLMPVAGTATVGWRDAAGWAVICTLTAGLFYAVHGGSCGDPRQDLVSLGLVSVGVVIVAVLCGVWSHFQRATEQDLDRLLVTERRERATTALLLDLATLVGRDVALAELVGEVLHTIGERLPVTRIEVRIYRGAEGDVEEFSYPEHAPEAGDVAPREFPITWAAEHFGTLRVWGASEEGFEANDRQVLSSVAAQLGHAATRIRSRVSLRRAAERDELTGLPNRRAFRSLLRNALSVCEQHGRTCALLYVDLNGFKRVNDALGHASGDQLLQDVARRLSRAIRYSDSACRGEESGVSRLGGDEFSLILDEIDTPENADVVARRILESLAKPFLLSGQSVFIGASIGIAIYPQDADEIDTLIACADAAMYAAKTRGKSGFLRYAPDMHEPDPISLESDLRSAIARGDLEVHYQPILCGHRGSVAGAEALLRWPHPERGMVPPVEFIALAERVGLIEELGDLVLEHSLRWLTDHQERLGPEFRLSLNVSPRQLENVGFIHRLARRLVDSSVPTSRIELEITETVLMEDSEETWEHIRALAGLGLGFALDDFGTGYSSLSLVKRMPISRLKIDRSFVDGLPDQPEDVAIVSAILGMARSLGVPVVAEGVEDEAQHEFLASRGCAEMQGWLFAKAMPADELLQWLEGREIS